MADWRAAAEEANVSFERIDRVARAIYNANRPNELPNHRHAPVWENSSGNVRDFVRRQALAAILESSRGTDE